MNARFNLAAAVRSATCDYEALLLSRIAELEQAVTLTVDGSHKRHCANMRVCDAWAALDKFRKNASHPQGFFA